MSDYENKHYIFADYENKHYILAARLPLPGDCADCTYPKFMHEEGEPKADCVFSEPDNDLRKRRLLLIRAAREKN